MIKSTFNIIPLSNWDYVLLITLSTLFSIIVASIFSTLTFTFKSSIAITRLGAMVVGTIIVFGHTRIEVPPSILNSITRFARSFLIIVPKNVWSTTPLECVPTSTGVEAGTCVAPSTLSKPSIALEKILVPEIILGLVDHDSYATIESTSIFLFSLYSSFLAYWIQMQI